MAMYKTQERTICWSSAPLENEQLKLQLYCECRLSVIAASSEENLPDSQRAAGGQETDASLRRGWRPNSELKESVMDTKTPDGSVENMQMSSQRWFCCKIDHGGVMCYN